MPALLPVTLMLALAGRERLLVLPPRDGVDDDALVAFVADGVAVALTHQSDYDVLSSAEIASLSDVLAERASVGCDTASCQSELAGAVDAAYLVTGSLTALGTSYALTLSLLDVSSSRVVGRASVQFHNREELPGVLPAAAHELLSTAAAPATTTSSSSSALGWGLFGGGAACAVVSAGVATGAALYANDANHAAVDRQRAEYVRVVGLAAAGVGIVVSGAGLVWWAATP